MIQDQLASHISESEIKRGMAYAAITCLMSTVHESMQVTGCNLQSFYEKLESSRTIMEKITAEPLEELTSLEAEIIKVACNTEDMVDSESRKILFVETADERINALWELFFILEQAAECVDSTMKQWMAIGDRYNNTRDREIQNFSLVDISQHTLEMENMMVGPENEFEMIKDQIARGTRELEVVSIVGMRGIGKTTLANKIYCDPFIVSHFDIRAKATLSQEHCVRNVLLRLLSSTRGKTDECYEEQDDGQLADRLQKLLKGKRYLIVIDDIWTTEAWDDIKLCFPDCNNGGRILLTTRNVEVAEYASSGATSQDPLRRLKFLMGSPSLPLHPTDDALPHLLLPPPDAFPQRLKKLAFSGTCLQWMDLSIVGKLPKLEVLKLENDACIGDEWEVVDEGFPYLKLLLLEHLKIRYWRASCDHFPCLERLFLERCLGLDSIPQDFADIATLALINISTCAESVRNSAKQIRQNIQDNYGTSVEVTIVRHVKAKNIYFS